MLFYVDVVVVVVATLVFTEVLNISTSSFCRLSGGAQKLLPSNVKPFDRFGASVSIDGDALIVGSHQEFEEGNLAYQRAVQVWLDLIARPARGRIVENAA